MGRSLVVVAALAAPWLFLSTGDRPHHASAACAPTLSWRGHGYDGVALRRPAVLRVGRRLATRARIPPCIDTVPPPDPLPREEKVVVRRYRGVSPRLALRTGDGGLWVASGFFPQLPSHPLHEALYGPRPGVPDATKSGRCFGRRVVHGVVRYPDLQIDPRGKGRRLDVHVDSMTQFRGFRRLGHPCLSRGDRVRIAGLRCRNANLYPPRYLVARSISRAR